MMASRKGEAQSGKWGRYGVCVSVSCNVPEFHLPITLNERAPQMIWVAFKCNDTFWDDNGSIKNIYIEMSSMGYRSSSNRTEENEIYQIQDHVHENYVQENSELTPTRDLCPVYCFDTSTQKLNRNNVSCVLHIYFKVQPPVNLQACVTWFRNDTTFTKKTNLAASPARLGAI